VGARRPLALKYSRGITRYVRRYLTPERHAESGPCEELAYDVIITELWFADEAIWRGTVDCIANNVMPEKIVANELNLFDRATVRMATVVERDTDFG